MRENERINIVTVSHCSMYLLSLITSIVRLFLFEQTEPIDGRGTEREGERKREWGRGRREKSIKKPIFTNICTENNIFTSIETANNRLLARILQHCITAHFD